MRAVSSVVLAYLMLRPVSNGSILYPLLAVLAVASTLALVFGRRRASPEVMGVLAGTLLAGIYGMTIGAYNPGVWQHSLVWLVAPLIYGVWVLAADERMLRSVMTTAAWATIALSFLIVAYVAAQLGGPSLVPGWLIQETGAGFDLEEQGATAIRLYGLSTLIAAAPMWITAAFVPNHPLLPRRSVRVIAAVLATTAALLGGRNAIVLVVVAVPLIVLLIRAMGRRSGKIHPAAFLTGVAILAMLPFVLPAILGNAAIQRAWLNITEFFSGSGGQVVRTEQVDQLIGAWAESPIFGHGLGATIPGYFRSAERPWNFELQYHVLLFQFGIVGCLLVVAVVVVALIAIRNGLRARPDLTPVMIVALAAAGGMLIGNATNPYLQAPGHGWAIWLPLMVANVAILNRQRDEDAPQPVSNRRTVRSH